jgi:hypothetical protein
MTHFLIQQEKIQKSLHKRIGIGIEIKGTDQIMEM